MRLTDRSIPQVPGMQLEDPFLSDHHRKRHLLNVEQNVMRDKNMDEELPWDEDFYDEPVKRASPPTPEKDPTEGKVLKFRCYFKEPVVERREEVERRRWCFLYYFLDDASIQIYEPRQDNSGMTQGQFLKRRRVPKSQKKTSTDPRDCLTFEDLAFGSEVEIFARVFYIGDGDNFTQEFLKSRGIPADPPKDFQLEDQTEHKASKKTSQTNNLGEETSELKRFHEYSFKGKSSVPSKRELELTQNILKYDRKVLRFYCVWDDRERLHGDLRKMVLNHFLSDNTTEINEILPPNSGEDPFPSFLKRQRIPKDPFCHRDELATNSTSFYTSLQDPTKKIDEQHQYYGPQDYSIGAKVNVYNRTLLIYDCDNFTRRYYKERFGMENMEPIPIQSEDHESKIKSSKKMQPPPRTFGSEEDSLSSWRNIIPKPPKKDIVKMLENEKSIVKFAADLVTENDEDAIRKFVITYYLSDDTLGIYEPPITNAGIVGGRFLKRQQVKKEDGSLLTPQDIQVGEVITVNKYKFHIIACDDTKAEKQHIPHLSDIHSQDPQHQPIQRSPPSKEVLDRALTKFEEKTSRKKRILQESIRSISDQTKDGLVGSEEFQYVLRERFHVDLSPEEAAALEDRFFLNQGQRLEAEEFIKVLQGTSTRYYATGVLK